jgi:hypothetical protein
MGAAAAPIDEAVLETIYERARAHPLIETVNGDRTSGTLSQVDATFDPDQYPDGIQAARLEVQWYTNGDYNLHYIETHSSGEEWQCRWDRHPNPHTSRTHFHPPPAARSRDAVPDSPSDRHPSAMFARTLANVRGRIETLWNTSSTQS